MTDAVHPSVARVVDAAADQGLKIEIRRFPEGTRTAEDAARAVGCSVGQIVKSLVFVADEAPILVLVSGADRADPDPDRGGHRGARCEHSATGDPAGHRG